jgi:putative spermidine/putrescine transport system substrate-binding protein
MKRRLAVIVIGAIGTLGLALLGDGVSQGQDKGVVVVASWGGSAQDALRTAMLKPFEKATGIRVIETTGPTIAKIRTMVTANNAEFDVANIPAPDLLVLAKNNFLEKVDYGRIDKAVLADVDPRVIHPHGIGYVFYSKVIAFSTKQYPRGTHPKSWAEFWDVQRFPGPRVIDAGNALVPPIEYALLADGVMPDKLYPLDFERAYRSLGRLKPAVVKWSTTAAMAPQALVDGEAHLAAATVGRIARLKEDGAAVDFEWNQGLLGLDYWAVPRGAKNFENAMKFLEFVSRPEPLAEFSKLQPLGPVNRRAFEFMSAERARMLPSYPEHLQKQVLINAEWWAMTDASGKSNIERNQELWSTWSLK